MVAGDAHVGHRGHDGLDAAHVLVTDEALHVLEVVGCTWVRGRAREAW